MKISIVFSIAGLAVCCAPLAADHKAPVDPIVFGSDHSHENHSGHVHERYGPNAQGSDLSYTNFSDSTYRNSLQEVNLTGAVFDRSLMTNVQALNATFVDASFRDVQWELGRIAEAQVVRTDFSGSRMPSFYLHDLQIDDSQFYGVDFRMSLFDNVDLGNADLSGARLGGANLATAVLGDVIFSGETTYDRFTRFPHDFDPVSAGLQLVDPDVPSQLGEISIRGVVNAFVLPGYYYGIAFDPSNESLLMLAYADDEGQILERRSTNGALISEIEPPVLGLDALDLMPDGNWIIGSEATGKVTVFDPGNSEIKSEGMYNFDEFEGWAYDVNRNSVFGTEDDGFLFELDTVGTVINCCFGTSEHENLGYYSAANSLVAVNENLDFLSPTGIVTRSIPLATGTFDEHVRLTDVLGTVRSIDIDEANHLLYAVYPADGMTTVRVYDLRLVPEPETRLFLALQAILFLCFVQRTRSSSAHVGEADARPSQSI